MMSDLVARLYEFHPLIYGEEGANLVHKAADEIVSLREQLAAMQEAVKQGQREILLKVADTLFENEQYYARDTVMKPVKEL